MSAMEVFSMSEIKISLTSKKFCCEFGIKEKLTFIRGDSGVGKTEFTKRVSSKTTANTINVSNGFNLNVLTKDVFETVYNNAMKHKNKTEKTRAQDETKFLAKYWSNEDNFPLQDNTIFIIDDEDFVKSHVFSVLFKCDRSNYYIIINRSNLPNLSYSADEVYNFISDGKNHYLERYFNYKEDAAIEHVDNVFVEGIGSDFIFFSRLFSNSNVFNPTSFSGVNGGGKDKNICAQKCECY